MVSVWARSCCGDSSGTNVGGCVDGGGRSVGGVTWLGDTVWAQTIREANISRLPTIAATVPNVCTRSMRHALALATWISAAACLHPVRHVQTQSGLKPRGSNSLCGACVHLLQSPC